MASPGSTTPRQCSPVDPVPPRCDAPQAKLSTFSPICPNQANPLSIINNSVFREQQEVAKSVAKHLGISYPSGQGDVVEDVDWIGGANGILRFFHSLDSLGFSLHMRGLQFQVPSDVSILCKDEVD